MSSPHTVLVLEDNAELRNVLKEALAGEGYHVVAVRDREEALELLRSERPDLLIADLSEARATEDTLESIRHEHPDLPVVALSDAAGRHPTMLFSAWAGQDRYRVLPKPFRLGELLGAARTALEPQPGESPSRRR